MTRWKVVASDWLPPVLLRGMRGLLQPRRNRIRFEGDFANWETAQAQCTGYAAEQILSKVLAAALKVKAGDAQFERDSVLFDRIEYSWPVLAGLLYAAARDGGRLNVLDFGGALGTRYFQNRKFLEALPAVHWNVVEQPQFVEAGRAYLQDNRLRFYRTIEECVGHNQPNVVLLSSVLQYLSHPYRCLADLLALRVPIFIIDRTAVLNSGDQDRICIQHVPESIYPASYPCRLFSERPFQSQIVAEGYRLLEEFLALDRLDTSAKSKGYIFER